jgi:hypothetical protein
MSSEIFNDRLFWDNIPGYANDESPSNPAWHKRNDRGELVPSAIDPEGCGCTECLTGEYYPLNRATPAMIRDMLAGYIANNTEVTFAVDVLVCSRMPEREWFRVTCMTYDR